jgi:GGDEF domain-containing protein
VPVKASDSDFPDRPKETTHGSEALFLDLDRSGGGHYLSEDPGLVDDRIHGPEAAEEFTAKLQQKLAQAMQNAGWPVTGSFGVAIFFTTPKGVDELIKRSDILLYCAKQKGKNVICLEVFRS